MVFSTNQARQFYVMKGTLNNGTFNTSNNVKSVVTDKKAPYIIVKGAAGDTRSDLLTNIESVKITDGGALARKLKSVKVVLDNSVVAGQDYILNIEFQQFTGMSDEEKYFKFGMVRGKSGMTATQFYVELLTSLFKNFSRELTKLLDFAVITETNKAAGTQTAVNSISDLATYTGAAAATQIAAICINEHSQAAEYRHGIKAVEPVLYTVTTGTIKVSGDDVTWGTVSNVVAGAGTINNGYLIADMEYFYMGERGDQYRKIGWPNNIDTTYLVTDPTASYDVLDVHYSYVGSGEGVQKSEKDLTVVTLHSNAAQLIALAKALAGAAGMTTYTSVSSTGAVTEENVVG